MSKSIRIRTKPGVDRDINIKIDQDFDFLEILSLKLKQEDIYTQFCAEYGVVVGRVIANGGLGIPNAHISIFIPIDDVDVNNPIISTLYPYKSPTTKNEDGYRYNLLPYTNEYYGHTATGTFPTVDDVLTRKEVLQVYEKYYKYSVRTNDSGDFMIVGVPLGSQKLVMDLDLSNMGEFSLRPSDLMRMGLGVASQFNGQLFKSSEDINSLPQIISEIKDIDVASFWGQDETCDVGITRADFDLSDQGIVITPHTAFMGSIFSSSEKDYIKASCRPKIHTGNLCDTISGPGQILAIRHTIKEDINGDPVLEEFRMEDGGNVIDDSGAWLIDLPMNLEYITTNEFGERVVSFDPTIGVATKAKYRFKVKWQNEAGLQAPIMRANYLIPNIKEHWDDTGVEFGPSNDGDLMGPNGEELNFNKSYAFSLDWNDYYDKDAAIKCEDTFYLFGYNKVYTTAAHIDRFKFGWNRASHYGIKEILNSTCMGEVNRFPTNDAQRNFDFLFLLFNMLLAFITPMVMVIIPIMHVLAILYPIFRIIINIIVAIINAIIFVICIIVAFFSRKQKKKDCKKSTIKPLKKENPFMRLTYPMMTYPDCERCPCDIESLPPGESETLDSATEDLSNFNETPLADFVNIGAYEYECVDDPSGGNNGECMACFNTHDTGSDSGSYMGVVFSGYDPYMPPPDLYMDPPPIEWIKSPFSLNKTGKKLRSTYNVTLPQSLNLMNQRSRYFANTGDGGPNRMRTEIWNENNTFSPITTTTPPNGIYNQFEDMPLITVMDSSVIFEPGQLISFVDPNLIDDPNVNNTGSTVNQYGNQSITGSVAWNPSSFLNTPITYIDSGGLEQTSTLQLENSTITGQSYNFKSGIEYFQVIGSMTVGDMKIHFSGASGNEKDESILWNYFINKTSKWYCKKGGNSGDFERTPLNLYDDMGDDLIVYFFSRGVDPYTPKQNIEYDLSPLFGRDYGQANSIRFENNISGGYYLNRPIQKLAGTTALDPTSGGPNLPAAHFPITLSTIPSYGQTTNDDNDTLYGESFLFSVDTNSFTSFTNSSMAYYASLDDNWSSVIPYSWGSNGTTVGNSMTISNSFPQGRIDGASFQYTNVVPTGTLQSSSINYTIAPSYWVDSVTPPTVNMTESTKLIVRSDRLPTSSSREQGSGTTRNYQDFPLHLNNRFEIFSISDLGESTSVPATITDGISDSTGNLQDMTGDTASKVFSNGVLESFTCPGLKVLDCYSGECTTFGVSTPCDNDKRTQGGCYVFVLSPLLVSIPKDFFYFFEWKSRYKFIFGACREIIGHLFQNNWINGTLYMPSFQKKSFYNSQNELKRYKYCGDPNQPNSGFFFSAREYRGPLYFNTDSNSFFYRSAPYYQGEFIPQKIKAGRLRFAGSNDGQLWQPTTIMDLGPKTDFLKEILLTPEFQGYIMDTLESTSFQDVSSLLNLFLISRLVDANFLENVMGTKDGSIQGLFSRQLTGLAGTLDKATGFFDSRVDGDYAQMLSINTEYGVLPYLPGNYADSLTVCHGMFGVWFTGETGNRRILGPGEITFSESPLLASQFDYPGTQEIPYYLWETQNNTLGTPLFGDQQNKWITDVCGRDFYQDSDFNGANDYPKANVLDRSPGYLYNIDSSGVESPDQASSISGNRYRVGSPFQFYFGLNRGKSAMNKFIIKYIFNDG